MKKWEKKYQEYNDIPDDPEERVNYLVEQLKLSEKMINKIKEEVVRIKKEKKKYKKFINLTFNIVPEGINRPRKGKFGFYVSNIQQFYDCVNKYVKEHEGMEKFKICGETKLVCKYYLPIPKSANKVEKILMELGLIPCLKKPDWDNLAKSTDMLARLWYDDSNVTEARVRKRYSSKPRIEIRIQYYTRLIDSFTKKMFKNKLDETWGDYYEG